MSFTDLNFLLALGAIVGAWTWLAQGRETADELSSRLCKELAFQRLDQSVTMAGLRIAKSNGRLRLVRLYRFEFSTNGDNRQEGLVCLFGGKAMWANLAHPDGNIRIDF
ncbi:MAG: DUF3301 domain-containing protein [Gammaproteobacteria bacterium]